MSKHDPKVTLLQIADYARHAQDWILFMKTGKKQAAEAEKPKKEKPTQK